MKFIYFFIIILWIFVFFALAYDKPSEQIQDTELFLSDNIWTELPMKRAAERIDKKPFGVKIPLDNSDRFSGYHIGIDYEIFENEKDIDVSVFAICDGKLLKKEKVSGYGGLLVQECELMSQLVTVLYGHVQLSSTKQEVGDNILLGDFLSLLGKAFSSDTGGERKHLHLGIHKGIEIDIRGYIQSQSDFKNWIDFELYKKLIK